MTNEVQLSTKTYCPIAKQDVYLVNPQQGNPFTALARIFPVPLRLLLL